MLAYSYILWKGKFICHNFPSILKLKLQNSSNLLLPTKSSKTVYAKGNFIACLASRTIFSFIFRWQHKVSEADDFTPRNELFLWFSSSDASAKATH